LEVLKFASVKTVTFGYSIQKYINFRNVNQPGKPRESEEAYIPLYQKNLHKKIMQVFLLESTSQIIQIS